MQPTWKELEGTVAPAERTPAQDCVASCCCIKQFDNSGLKHQRKRPSSVSVTSRLAKMAACVSHSFKIRCDIMCSNPLSHPGSYSADSLSMWQDVVVEAALPALVSLRKLGFSIVTATSLPTGFSSVKARFSDVLAESPSLSTHIKFKTAETDYSDKHSQISCRKRAVKWNIFPESRCKSHWLFGVG